jgi:uncharacterized membrane protein YjgN (DUF898 family)
VERGPRGPLSTPIPIGLKGGKLDLSVASPPPPPPSYEYPPPPQSASTNAIVSLVLGILGVVCCSLMAPIAWYLGNQEIKAIQAGSSPAAGDGLARAGMILGIVGVVVFGLQLIWIFFMGGMVMLSAFADQFGH